MKLIKKLQQIAVVAATFGILLPQSAVLNAAERTAAPKQVQAVKDLALGAGGTLRGQIVNKDGIAEKGATVTVLRDGGKVASVRADENGVFTFRGVQGGVYAITSGKATGVVRAWTQNTAPPAASQAVLLVPNDLTVRGQDRLHDLIHNGGLTPGQIGLGGLLVLGLVGTIIAISVSNDAS